MPGNRPIPQPDWDLSGFEMLRNVLKNITQHIDPYGIVTPQLDANLAWLMHPNELLSAAQNGWTELAGLWDYGLRRTLGLPCDGIRTVNPDDERFADPQWRESVFWDMVKQSYLTITHALQDMYAQTPGLSDHERQVSEFWQRNWLNAMAPTNFFWLNPQAMARAAQTQGESVELGLKNFWRDWQARNIQMVDPDAFVVGKDLATTPGQVVFRNRLMELIHYAPSTAQVRAMPIVIIAPWINKYYILDLDQRKSLVRYLTGQGFSVFITSWKNPGTDMRGVSLDNYLLEGAHEAVRVATEFCRVPKAHLVGYCLGGTLAAIYMAWANKRFGPDRMAVAHWTLFATLTDFSHPGDIDVFIDPASIDALEELMAQKGYLDGAQMAASFRLLRANSLIWNYWVRSYLLGEPLPQLDVLFWNMDTTRMPEAMHAYYLRQMYLHNKLVQSDQLTLAGEKIDLRRITQPLYAVTARDDHVAPWKQCYLIRQAVNAATPVRFVLSTSGHVLGIVNPPVDPPKRAYWAGQAEAGESCEHWLERADNQPGSWWEDWTAWLHERTGAMVRAYPAARRPFPALQAAPGSYVLEK